MARPTKREQKNKKISMAMCKMTPEAINKLEQAFAIDATVEEACFYTGISVPTFYSWKKKNEKLFKGLEALREKPVLKARQTIVNNLDTPEGARWYIERKRKKEFSTRQEFGHEGEFNFNVNLSTVNANNQLEKDNQTGGGLESPDRPENN